MHLETIDLVIIAGSVLVCFVPALLMARQAGKNTEEFFTSGRAAPAFSPPATSFMAVWLRPPC